jgi:hypothetical protein
MDDAAPLRIALDDASQAAIVGAVARAHGLHAGMVDPGAPLLEAARRARVSNSLWIVEVDRLHRERTTPGAAIVALRSADPGATLLLAQGRRLVVDSLLQGWARQAGAIGFIPGMAVERFDSTVKAALRPAIEHFGIEWIDAAARRALDDVVAGAAAAPVPAASTARAAAGHGSGLASHAALAHSHRALARLEAAGLDLAALDAWARSPLGFECGERIWHLGTYRDCFIGSAAVTRLSERLSVERALAVELGEAMRRARHLQHVLNEHPFRDAALFYRFTPCTARVAAINLASLLAHVVGRGGFERANRLYLGRTYRDCFIGAEAAEWLRDRYGLDVDEAIYVGEALVDLGVARHVAGEHDFKDAGLYYEFTGFGRE